MGTRKKILSLLLMIVLLLPVGMGIHVEAAAETKQVDVLFTHDTHSHLNSYIYFTYAKCHIDTISRFMV